MGSKRSGGKMGRGKVEAKEKQREDGTIKDEMEDYNERGGREEKKED